MDKLKQAQKEAMEQYRDGLISYKEATEQITRARKNLEIIETRKRWRGSHDRHIFTKTIE